MPLLVDSGIFQVKIKSEVASSNRQSEKLREALSTLTRRVDACRDPNMDKEVRTTASYGSFGWSSLNRHLVFGQLLRYKEVEIDAVA